MEIKIQNVSMTYPSGKAGPEGAEPGVKNPPASSGCWAQRAGNATSMKLLVAALQPTEGHLNRTSSVGSQSRYDL